MNGDNGEDRSFYQPPELAQRSCSRSLNLASLTADPFGGQQLCASVDGITTEALVGLDPRQQQLAVAAQLRAVLSRDSAGEYGSRLRAKNSEAVVRRGAARTRNDVVGVAQRGLRNAARVGVRDAAKSQQQSQHRRPRNHIAARRGRPFAFLVCT